MQEEHGIGSCNQTIGQPAANHAGGAKARVEEEVSLPQSVKLPVLQGSPSYLIGIEQVFKNHN